MTKVCFDRMLNESKSDTGSESRSEAFPIEASLPPRRWISANVGSVTAQWPRQLGAYACEVSCGNVCLS